MDAALRERMLARAEELVNTLTTWVHRHPDADFTARETLVLEQGAACCAPCSPKAECRGALDVVGWRDPDQEVGGQEAVLQREIARRAAAMSLGGDS